MENEIEITDAIYDIKDALGAYRAIEQLALNDGKSDENLTHCNRNNFVSLLKILNDRFETLIETALCICKKNKTTKQNQQEVA